MDDIETIKKQLDEITKELSKKVNKTDLIAANIIEKQEPSTHADEKNGHQYNQSIYQVIQQSVNQTFKQINMDGNEASKTAELSEKLNTTINQLNTLRADFEFYKKSVSGDMIRIDTNINELKEKINNMSIEVGLLTSRLNTEKIDIKITDEMMTSIRHRISSFVNEHVKRYDILIVDLKKEIDAIITKMTVIPPVAQTEFLNTIKSRVDSIDSIISIISNKIEKTAEITTHVKNEHISNKAIIDNFKNVVDEVQQISIEVANMSSPNKIKIGDDVVNVLRGLEGRVALIEKTKITQQQQSVQYQPVNRRK